MMMFRSLVVGLLGACLLLILMRPEAPTRVVVLGHEQAFVAMSMPTDVPTIIDVAPGLSSSQIAQLVRLAPEERVTAVDDRPVTSNLDAGTVIAGTGRTFIDLTIGRFEHGPQRRVLVLVH